MIRKTCFALLIVAVLFAAVSCKTAAIEDGGIKLEGECKNYKYTIAADGLELTLDVEGNPTTGYQWVLLTDDGKLDESVTLRGSEYKQNKAPEMMVGVGGYFTFDVDFSKDGEFDLQFAYCRSWAPEDNPVYMTLSVKVEGNKITEVSVN